MTLEAWCLTLLLIGLLCLWLGWAAGEVRS